MEKQKFSPSILVLIKFIIVMTVPFFFVASVVFLFTNISFKLPMEYSIAAIGAILMVFIIYIYYKMSIKVVIENDRIFIKKLFITRIDDNIHDLKFDGFVSSGIYSDQYGNKSILKTLFTPSKVRLVFSNGGSRIKIDASGLGQTRGEECIRAIYNTGIKGF